MSDAGTGGWQGPGALRDGATVRALLADLARRDPGRTLRLMHVCGTHEHALCHAGLRSLLPGWIRMVAGPGCPVCVCPASDIDQAVRLGLDRNAVVATFGDVIRVPARTSLEQARAQGADVRVVRGVHDAVRLARELPSREVVFFAVGFETTACTTAAALLDDPPGNFSVLDAHRLVPPALDALIAAGDGPDGFLLPGHVTTVTGLGAYRDLAARHGLAMTAGGFEPVDLVDAIRDLVDRVVGGRVAVGNAYRRAVREHGNPTATAWIDRVFVPCDAAWRGLGVIPGSGLALRDRFAERDARRRFALQPDPSLEDMAPGCRCGEVLRGRVEPEDCPLFGRACVPEAPVGPCMVAFEGTCHARWLHGGAGRRAAR